MSILYYFITWLIVTFVQVVVVPRLAILGIYPDILAAFVVIISLKHGRAMGVWFGFTLAISIDLLDPQKLGWMTLLISAMAYLVGLIRDTLYFENPWFEATMVLLATFFYHLAYRFFPAPQFFFDNMFRMLAESIFIAIYTVAVAGLGIWLLRQKPGIREVM